MTNVLLQFLADHEAVIRERGTYAPGKISFQKCFHTGERAAAGADAWKSVK